MRQIEKAKEAARARINGEFDNTYLTHAGDLLTDTAEDIDRIYRFFLEEDAGRININKYISNIELVLAVCTSNITMEDCRLITGDPSAPKRVMEHDNAHGTLFDCCLLDDHDLHELRVHGFSEDFVTIMKDAHEHGFDMVVFDRDAPELPKEYPVFDH